MTTRAPVNATSLATVARELGTTKARAAKLAAEAGLTVTKSGHVIEDPRGDGMGWDRLAEFSGNFEIRKNPKKGIRQLHMKNPSDRVKAIKALLPKDYSVKEGTGSQRGCVVVHRPLRYDNLEWCRLSRRLRAVFPNVDFGYTLAAEPFCHYWLDLDDKGRERADAARATKLAKMPRAELTAVPQTVVARALRLHNPTSPQDAQYAVKVLGWNKAGEYLGPGGLSGATGYQLFQLVAAAKKQVKAQGKRWPRSRRQNPGVGSFLDSGLSADAYMRKVKAQQRRDLAGIKLAWSHRVQGGVDIYEAPFHGGKVVIYHGPKAGLPSYAVYWNHSHYSNENTLASAKSKGREAAGYFNGLSSNAMGRMVKE